MDLTLAILTLRAGYLLKAEDPDAPSSALVASGPLFIISLAYVLLILGELRHFRENLAQILKKDHAALPRMVYYTMAFIFLPYGIFTLLRRSPRPERADLVWALLGSTMFSTIPILLYVAIIFFARFI